MGVKDQALLEYLKDANRFADLVNGTMFCGRQIVDPQYLTTIPRKKRLLLQNFSGKETGMEIISEKPEVTEEEVQMVQQDASNGEVLPSFLERERDLMMLYEKQGEKCFIGCEGQTEADYCMPVRELTYDGIEYSDQLDQLHRCKYITKEKSGVSRPLAPVFSEVLYLGETRWNSKHRLQEMMNIPESMMDFKDLLPEYRVHIVDIHEQDPEVFHTEWKDIFRLMKHSRKKEELKHYVEAHIEEIRKLSMDTRIFLSILLDQYSILKDGKVEVKEMCQAWDGAMMMYYEEGMSEGISQGIQTNRQETIRRMLSRNKYTYEEIGELNGVAVETVKKIENQFC